MSSEMVGKSNFSVTVSLLSQYIKEKGSLGDLGIGIAAKGKSDTFRPPTTMSLLPGVDVSDAADISDRNAAMELFPQRAGFGPAADGGERKAEKSPSQLTIFYGGKVLVFDNFPAEKAKDLMQFASKGTSAAAAAAPNLGGYVAPAATVSSGFVSAPANPPAAVQRTANVSDLPIARKASLHRFLEKRKDRINAKAPYQVNGGSMSATSVKQEEKQWLGLGPQVGKANLSSELSR